jgi:Domain of unknown function (DUF397)
MSDTPIWIKSSYSGSEGGGECVEVATHPDGGLAVRDSKNKTGPMLRFTDDEWHAFTAGVKAGEFDE